MDKLLRRSRCNAALARLAAGDTAALTDLYDAAGREIFALALSVTGNRHDAEDVMQDTFLRVVRSIGTYTPGDGGRAWVLTVARNIALDTVRRRRVSVPLEDGEPSDDGSLGEALGREAAFEMLQTVGEPDRTIVMLRVLTGLRNREVAAVVGMTPDAVQKRYRRALERLKAENMEKRSK